MTILLAGSTGFLGSYLLKLFVKKNYKVIALKRSHSDTFRITSYLNRVEFYNIDEVELSNIFKEYKFDLVVNTVTNYGRNDRQVFSIVNTNLIFSLKLLEESVNNNVKAFINTDTLLNKKINAYSLSKSQFTEWMKFLKKENTRMINIKIEHMYGPNDDNNKFIYCLINQLKENVDNIDLTSGIQKRDFIYIDDIVRAYEIIIENISNFSSYENFQLGSGKTIKVKKFIKKIYKEISKKQKLTTKLNFGSIKYRKNEEMNMKVNIDKIIKLGWKPKVSVKTGIINIIKEA